MTAKVAPVGDRLATWCGWVLVGLAGLTPLMAYFGSLGFAALLALAGLLMLPALRIQDADRPLAVALLLGLVWAAVSTIWSPYQPKAGGAVTILKLTLELPLYWACVCGARRADPRVAALALRVLAWGLAAVGAVLVAEAALGGLIYRTIHVALYEPIRPDLAIKNLGKVTFVLALLWPLAAVGGARAGAPAWLAAPMALGVGVAAFMFGADAPVLSLLVAAVAAFVVWRCPNLGPKVLGGIAAFLFLVMPALVWAVRSTGELPQIQALTPLSWSQRLGYWSHAIDWISDHPLRGWGLDASRMFGPAIQLHPHNGALQLWLELGVLGALLGAAVWGLALLGLSRPVRDRAAMAAAASIGVYLLFGLANFGIWQEWWLALAAMIGVISVLAFRQPVRESTSTPISE